MWNTKIKNLELWLVVAYSFLYLITSLFLSNSVWMQTVYNLFIIAIIFLVLYNYKPPDNSYGFIKAVAVYFWLGQSWMYLINFFMYSDVNVWLNEFNDIRLLIPVYIGSLFLAIWATYERAN